MRGYYNMLKTQIILDFKELFRYKINIISDFMLFTLMYIAIFYFNASTAFSSFYSLSETEGEVLVLVGYIFWQMSSTALGFSSSTIKCEADKGILELKLQSKFNIIFIMFIQLFSYMVYSILSILGIFLFMIIIGNTSIHELKMIFLSYIYCIPSVIGMFGMGLIIGGIALIQKSVGQFTYIIQTALLFISNALSPTRPAIIYILPFSYGIDITRNKYLGGPVEIRHIIMYIAVNLLWLLVGTLIFNICLKHIKRCGSFDTY